MEYTFNLDPAYGIKRFVSYISLCFDTKAEEQLLWNGVVTFSLEHIRFYIESGDSEGPFSISDGESLYANIEKEDFHVLVKHLGIKINTSEDGQVMTDKFTGNDLLHALSHIEKLVKLDDIIADLK